MSQDNEREILRPAAYPSNSHKDKTEKKEEPKKVVKVIKGNVIKRKKPLCKRMLETFMGEDIGDVKTYVLHDVLIPAAKNMLYDTVVGSMGMSLFGEKEVSRNRKNKLNGYVSYDRMSSRKEDRREVSKKDRARHNFDDIAFETRGEAEEVLDNLVDLIIDYGEATVSAFYDLVGIDDEYTDRNYGWKDLSSASVSRVREGYVLNLPKPRYLE